MDHVLGRTKLDVSPGKTVVLNALLGELHLPGGNGSGNDVWRFGRVSFISSEQALLLNALLTHAALMKYVRPRGLQVRALVAVRWS